MLSHDKSEIFLEYQRHMFRVKESANFSDLALLQAIKEMKIFLDTYSGVLLLSPDSKVRDQIKFYLDFGNKV